MIKFLHTADLHLGKVFHDQSLVEDQAVMLEDLARLLADESYAALLIAGDVYDRSIPSPEAVELFGSFLGKVKKQRPSLEIIVIPGNHDSASRLGFGRELFAHLGIRFGVSAEECDKPLIVEGDGESCAFFFLPFLNPGVLSKESPEGTEEIPLRSQSAMAEEAARRMERARQEFAGQGHAYSVLVAHLFASGGTNAGSERVFLGNAESVNPALFSGFDYIALGHLHRCQSAGEKVWYPGSPLAYSFGESSPQRGGQDKYFLSVELEKDGAKIEKIPVNPRRKVTSLSGPFARFAGGILLDTSAEKTEDPELLAAAEDYLEIRLTDRGITENARELLRKRFPYLLSLKQDEALAHLSSISGASRDGRRNTQSRGLDVDFRDFLSSLYGEIEQPDVSGDFSTDLISEIGLFKALLAEVESGILEE